MKRIYDPPLSTNIRHEWLCRLLSIIWWLLPLNFLSAQTVSNVTAEQVGKTIHVSYNLDKQAHITLFLSTDGGKTYKELHKVGGAVGKNVNPGQLTIVWNVLDEVENLQGNNFVFKVKAEPFTCGDSTIRDYDGNVYKTVQIGGQCWMRENLKTTHYSDGAAIRLGNRSRSSTSEAYRYEGSGNVSTYGYLYNWKAVMRNSSSSDSNPSGVQGICPSGWHVPSDAEWTELTRYVSSKRRYVCGNDTSKIAKSLAAKSFWKFSYAYRCKCNVGNTGGHSNATGFAAEPAGYYCGASGYHSYKIVEDGRSAYFWSSTKVSGYNVLTRCLMYNFPYVFRQPLSKDSGSSVRCVRD